MRRTALSGLTRTAAAAALTVLVGACGTAGTSRTTTRTHPASPAAGLSVMPSTGAPTTVFKLQFVVPSGAEAGSGSRTSFELGVSGPQQSGCLAARSVAVPAGAPGTTVHIALDPAQLGGRWCAGTFHARVDEVQRPVCAPGMMCPQFLRVIGTVGRTTFRVVSVA
jgi:hypothetical protein